MVEIGKCNRLRVIRKTDTGVLLDGMNLGDIFMPNSYARMDCAAGDDIDVFIFPDSEGQLLATTKKPSSTRWALNCGYPTNRAGGRQSKKGIPTMMHTSSASWHR